MPSKICFKCGYTSDEPMDFCKNCRINLNQDYDLDTNLYAHPADVKARSALGKMKPVKIAVQAFMNKLGMRWIKATLLGSAVRVSERQFPHIHKIVVEAGKVLAVKRLPQVYVRYDPYMNAMALGTTEEPIIVLTSALVDAMNENELRMVIGHEMGHIRNEHVIYLTLLYALRSGLASVLAGPLQLTIKGVDLAILAWMRKSEYTADRAGLIVCRDLQIAKRTLMKIHLGSKKLFDQVDLEEYERQIEELDEEKIGKWSELELSHPFGVRRLRNIEEFYQDPAYTEIREIVESYLKGKPVERAKPAPTVLRCPECHEIVDPEDKFCPYCGARLR